MAYSLSPLPNRLDYEVATSTLTEEFEEKGNAANALYEYRKENEGSQDLYDFMIGAALWGLGIEKREFDEKTLVDKSHPVANATTSGMIFGQMVTSLVHPSLPRTKLIINLAPKVDVPEELQASVIEAGGVETPAGRAVSFRILASIALSRLSNESRMHLNTWSFSTIKDPTYRPAFLAGIGVMLFSGYDYHKRMLDKAHSSYVADDAPQQ